ncbi:MAG: DUF72 domain-containing protein [Bacteroidota bacterium]
MKFGKLSNIESVDFSLPPDASTNQNILATATQKEGAAKHLQFYIGCTGWSMKEWVGTVYPKGTKTTDYLRHYGQQFNTIELNTTHYRIPTLEMIAKWKDQTPSDFRFCPKIPQTISHRRQLGAYSSALTQFADAIQGLEERLGCCFMQLPPYFGSDRLPQLTQFVEQFPNHIPLAIEVRHESWFDTPNAASGLVDLLQKHHMAWVLTDVAGRRDVLHMQLTNRTAMVRFVGNGLHPTDYSRIDDWVERLATWYQQGLSEVYFFPHEPDNVLAPQLAAYLLEQVQKLSFVQVRGPKLRDEQEGQMSLF